MEILAKFFEVFHLNYSITDEGKYQCTVCDRVSDTQLAHHSHHRRHKKDLAAEPVSEPAPGAAPRTTRTVVGAQAARPTSKPVSNELPVNDIPKRGQPWWERLWFGSDD